MTSCIPTTSLRYEGEAVKGKGAGPPLAYPPSNSEDRLWWTQCAMRLGRGPVDRALGKLKEACHLGQVRGKGALLTKIFKDIAEEAKITLN